MNNKKFLYSVLVVLSFTTSVYSADYKSKYRASYKNMTGDVQYTISEKNGQYDASLTLIPNNFLVKMAIGNLTDYVSGNFIEGHFYPNQYNRIKNGKTDLRVKFNREQITVTEDGKSKQFNIPPWGQDPLSQMAQIQYDMKNRKLQSEYILVTNGNQRNYSVTRNGNKVTLTEKPSKHRQLIIWFNKSASSLLKMQKKKFGKVQFFMEKI